MLLTHYRYVVSVSKKLTLLLVVDSLEKGKLKTRLLTDFDSQVKDNQKSHNSITRKEKRNRVRSIVTLVCSEKGCQWPEPTFDSSIEHYCPSQSCSLDIDEIID